MAIIRSSCLSAASPEERSENTAAGTYGKKWSASRLNEEYTRRISPPSNSVQITETGSLLSVLTNGMNKLTALKQQRSVEM